MRLYYILLVLMLTGCSSTMSVIDNNMKADPARIQAHITFLASDMLRGRETGSPGYQIAAEYVASQMQQLGLKPAGDAGSYFQSVSLIEAKIGEDNPSLVIHGESDVALKYPDDFISGPDATRAATSVTGDLVFVGYGISAPRFDHDDYADIDVAGKIVVTMVGRPEAWPSEEGAHLGSGRLKVETAAKHGAIGRIVIQSPRDEETFPFKDNFQYLDFPRMRWLHPDGRAEGTWPQIKGYAYVDMPAAKRLFKNSPIPLKDLYAADSGGQPLQRFPLNIATTLGSTGVHRTLSSPNVVGILEGSDPILKDEYVLYTAHLDHLGVVTDKDGNEQVMNGAMDNAAGVAFLIETARVLAAHQRQMKRSALFLVVTAEEKGLLGAGHYAKYPTVPIQSIVANVNLDMPLVTYPFADVIAYGAEHSSLKSVVERAAAPHGIKLSPDPQPEQSLFTRSDHYRFVQQGIPAVFLSPGWESKDPDQSGKAVWQHHLKNHYHKPSDDLNLPIDYEAAALFTDIKVSIGLEICTNPERPTWNEGNFFGDTFTKK